MAECATRVRARPPAAPVGLVPRAQAHAAHVRPRALPRGSSTRLRDAIPDLALGTDIIVGFPGETEEDFAQTLEVVEEVRYDSAFTFIFSPRSGTEAADMPDQVPDEVKHERLERLVEVVQRIAAERNAERVGARRGGARRRPEPDRRRAAARPHAAQHDRELRRLRRARRARRRPDRRLDLDDAARCRARRSRRLALRTLAWDGCVNVRDLGGHATEDGG